MTSEKMSWREKLVITLSAIIASVFVLSMIYSGYKKEEQVFWKLKNEGCAKVGFVQAETLLGKDRYTYECKNGKTYTITKDFHLKNDRYVPWL